LLVPAEDPGALASEIRRLLDDAALRQSLGRRAHEAWKAQFQVAGMVAAYERIYRVTR
jgi:hypothetical protein